jgi:protoheme IX farnesyltransferase
MLKKYYQLTKPGIVYGNVFTTLASFLFASRWHFSSVLFFATLLGIAFVIASACVFNNYIDRDIDSKMARTKNRTFVLGTIDIRIALIYATLLLLAGVSLLYFYVNALTALVTAAGFIFYVFLYGFAKRTSHWGTEVGSVSGAVPILVGYTAISNHLDAPALILFLTLAFWQMPHFYAIAMYRLDDYRGAGIPVLPAVKGIRATKVYVVLYIIAFFIAASMLTVFSHAGYLHLSIVSLISIVWLYRGLQGFKASDDTKWARKLFFLSLVVLVVFSVSLSLASILP